MYGTLFGRCGIHSNAHHNIFSICFKFTIPRDHFCDVLSVSFSLSLLLLKMSFNPFQDGLFGAAHGWGGGTAKRPPSLKSVTPIVQWWNLAQLYLTQGRSKKYMNHVTYPLSSADISSFSQEINKFSYIKKYRYRLHFDALFLFILTFLESL